MMETETGPPLRQASTLILVRPYRNKFQVYLLKRNVKSAFMGGYHVFPGGTIDAEDRNAGLWRRHVDMEAKTILKRFGRNDDLEETLAYCIAALREAFEEAGVLLACRQAPGGKKLEEIYNRCLAGPPPKGWLKELVELNGWLLVLNRLKRWSHWITPTLMKQRYDTRFFLTILSEDQACTPDGYEATSGLWLTPQEGLLGNLEGGIPLSPPTLVTLHQLLQYRKLSSLEEALKERQWGEAVFPRLIPLDDDAIILEPWDPDYRKEDVFIKTQTLETVVLPIDAPFSRLWLHDGIWRAVARS